MPDGLAMRLAEARRRGDLVEGTLPELDVDGGYAVVAALAGSMPPVVGWKVGATNGPAQVFLGVAEPIYGRVFEGAVARDGAVPPIPGARPAEAEPEILFELAADPDPADPLAAVGTAFVGMEINRPSRDDAFACGAGFIVADNAAQVGLIVGPAIPMDALDDPHAIRVTVSRNGEVSEHGDAAAVMGNPRAALVWLAGKRAGSERPLRRGDIVATGAMCRSVPLAPGDVVAADFGAWGTLNCERGS